LPERDSGKACLIDTGIANVAQPSVGQHYLQGMLVTALFKPFFYLEKLLSTWFGDIGVKHHCVQATHFPHDGA